MKSNTEVVVSALSKRKVFKSPEGFRDWVRNMYVDRGGVFSPLESAAIEKFAELFADQPTEDPLDVSILESGRAFRFIVPSKPPPEPTPFDQDLEEALAALEMAKASTYKAISDVVSAKRAHRNGKKGKVSIDRVRQLEENYRDVARSESRARVQVNRLAGSRDRFRALRRYEREQGK